MVEEGKKPDSLTVAQAAWMGWPTVSWVVWGLDLTNVLVVLALALTVVPQMEGVLRGLGLVEGVQAGPWVVLLLMVGLILVQVWFGWWLGKKYRQTPDLDSGIWIRVALAIAGFWLGQGILSGILIQVLMWPMYGLAGGR